MIKKFGVMLIFASACASSVAAWVEVAQASNYTLYMETSTVRKTAEKVKVWLLMNFSEMQTGSDGKPYLSDKYQDEFDCREEMHRSLFISFTKESMGIGDVIWSSNLGPQAEWRPVVPDSVAYGVMKRLCKK